MSREAVNLALRAFADRAAAIKGSDYFECEYDPEWRSDCEFSVLPEQGISRWRPAPQSPRVDFSGLANAVEQPIHEDICAFYGSFWSGHFEAESQEGHVSLIQLWNPEDFDRLIANLIGHLLSKQRARQGFTVFVANTEPDSQLFLSIDNESGRVLLEEPGRAPIRVVEDNIATFLDRLTPLDIPPTIY